MDTGFRRYDAIDRNSALAMSLPPKVNLFFALPLVMAL
jgi:hypothetical protein